MSSPAGPLLPIPKLRRLPDAVRERESLEAAGRKVVLTNGCFDLLHAGHLYFLQQASEQGDALFIALNSDTSVRTLKGSSRPIQPEIERAYALAALACTHTVVLFDQPRLVPEIRALHPDVYVKAGDYTVETLAADERAALLEVGARIQILPFLPGYSTSDLLRRIAAAHASA